MRRDLFDRRMLFVGRQIQKAVVNRDRLAIDVELWSLHDTPLHAAFRGVARAWCRSGSPFTHLVHGALSRQV